MRRASVLSPVLAAALLALAPSSAAAQNDVAPATSAARSQPRKVTIGIYLNQIFQLNVKDNSFTCDFYIWFRWDGDDELKPLDTFEIVNGKIDSKNVLEVKKVGATNYACARVNATIVEFFDLSKFPLDGHLLQIEIEDTKDDANGLTFVNDVASTAVSPRVQVRGYVIPKMWSEVVTHTYKTSYGDPALPAAHESKNSRFVFNLTLARPDHGFLLKLYWTVFLSTVIGLLALRVKPNDLDPRFGLGVGAIFACAASTYVITSYIPDTDYITLADKLNFAAVSVVFASILQSTIALRYQVTGREHVAEKLDFWCFWGMLVAYAVANVVIIKTS